MTEKLKIAGIVGPVVLALFWAIFHFGQITERERISSLPADTVTVIQPETVQVIKTLQRLDTVRVSHVDTVYRDSVSTHPSYVAWGDTLFDNGVRVEAEFIQGLPIASDALFRFHLTLPDSLKTVPEKIVYITKTVVSHELPWQWGSLVLVIGFLLGFML